MPNSTADLLPGRITENLRPLVVGAACIFHPNTEGSWKTSQFCLGTEGSLGFNCQQ